MATPDDCPQLVEEGGIVPRRIVTGSLDVD
jgi:hypothetical protein